MGEADFYQFIRQRNQLVVAADNFFREENLSPVLQSTLFKDMEEQLKLVHKVIDVVDRLNRKICVTMLRYKVDNPETTYAQVLVLHSTAGLAFCSTDLGHICGNNVGNQFGKLMKRKGPHEPQFAYDIVCIHSLMIYSDLEEYSFLGDTNVLLLRCFPFISKLKGGDIITTGQYMNYQTFSNLQFRPLLKNVFHSIHIDLRDTSGEKIPLLSVGVTRFVLMLRKVNSIHF